MPETREIFEGSTAVAAEAMLALRPQLETPEKLVMFVDKRLRPAGYRLVGAFDGSDPRALAVAGFRPSTTLAWGLTLYVDDLSTLPAERGVGHADRLMTWLIEEARRLGCDALHLDSGVGPDRATAHRLYMRHKLRISAHHFQRDL